MKTNNFAVKAALIFTVGLLLPFSLWAQAQGGAGGVAAFTSTPGPGGSLTYTVPIQTLLVITALTFIPASLLMMTSFVRCIIVFALIRHALGTQQSPPHMVLVGLALFLTLFVMSPVLQKIYTDAYVPFSENRLSFPEAIDRGAVPLREFMLKQTREADIMLFTRLANIEKPATAQELPMRVLIPSFLTSELKTAFQIGFIIYIPFLIVDMVVASVLMSMGMMMMSPVMVSLPFKVMLFVLVDGWHLLMGSLVMSFAT